MYGKGRLGDGIGRGALYLSYEYVWVWMRRGV